MNPRKYLSASGLFKLVRQKFAEITDQRTEQAGISLTDILMSGFALFSLKDRSLLAFDQRRAEPDNLHRLYGIEQIPCDTYLRTVLDEVDPDSLRGVYRAVFGQLQRGQGLAPYQFMGKYYLLSVDGTGYFSSKKIYCPDCLVKTLKNGEVLYQHHMWGASLVHPDLKTVIPLMPEPIIKQDGVQKNDCERNAAKRFFKKLRQDHPQLPLIVTEDALSSNAPHLQALNKYNLRFILGVKEGDHAFLFAQVAQARQEGRSTVYEITAQGVSHRFHFINQVPLNASQPDLLVNFFEYWEIGPHKTQYFSWITDLPLDCASVYPLMRGGRARWKVENETFNTLKNQGYQFDHNFGHGQHHLSVVLALLMMLAFLVDQVQQSACPLFQAVLNKVGSKIRLWEKMRNLFASLPFDSMEMLYKAILYGYRLEKFVILQDSG